MGIILHIVVAALAVLGLYFLLKVIFSLIFQSHTATAVIIEDKISLRSLDILLDDAKSAVLFSQRGRIVVLLPENVLSECDEGDKALLRETAESYGAKIYSI